MADKDMSQMVRGNGAAPVTPKLAKPDSVQANAEAPSVEAHEDLLGKPAPTNDAPVLDKATLQKFINEAVEEQVKERLAAIEAGDPNREDFEDDDAQFANFDKRLDVYGVDINLPGFKTRWCNDDGDRIMRMQVLGYEFVKRTEVAINQKLTPLNQDMGEYIAVYVGKNSDGGPMRAYLMKIPEDLFNKRQARQQRKDDQIEDAIRRGGIGNALSQHGYAGTDGPNGVKIAYDPKRGHFVSRQRAT